MKQLCRFDSISGGSSKLSARDAAYFEPRWVVLELPEVQHRYLRQSLYIWGTGNIMSYLKQFSCQTTSFIALTCGDLMAEPSEITSQFIIFSTDWIGEREREKVYSWSSLLCHLSVIL